METSMYIFLYIIFKIHIHCWSVKPHVKFVNDFIKVLPHFAAFLSSSKINLLSIPFLTLTSSINGSLLTLLSGKYVKHNLGVRASSGAVSFHAS